MKTETQTRRIYISKNKRLLQIMTRDKIFWRILFIPQRRFLFFFWKAYKDETSKYPVWFYSEEEAKMFLKLN